MLLSGVHQSFNGFPLKTCGNDEASFGVLNPKRNKPKLRIGKRDRERKGTGFFP
jgi:hypothetical protein